MTECEALGGSNSAVDAFMELSNACDKQLECCPVAVVMSPLCTLLIVLVVLTGFTTWGRLELNH